MKSITQKLILAEGGDKRSKLSLLKPILRKERTIVFCGKKHVAKWVSQQLGKDGTRAVEIHGDRSQGQREAALRAFKGGEVDVLVATDVASRGIDVPDVQHVIHPTCRRPMPTLTRTSTVSAARAARARAGARRASSCRATSRRLATVTYGRRSRACSTRMGRRCRNGLTRFGRGMRSHERWWCRSERRRGCRQRSRRSGERARATTVGRGERRPRRRGGHRMPGRREMEEREICMCVKGPELPVLRCVATSTVPNPNPTQSSWSTHAQIIGSM